ncbi:MAG: hypothetical protein IT555_16495 [Acetobacteraceae bacterium]|nr:hypothetical protein [Acetobacteraceae bacterium]
MTSPTWLFEREVARGVVRIGILGTRFQAELNGRLLKLGNNDIVKLADLAASRHTAHLVKPLRDGGYTHLLGGSVGLLAEEARMLREVALGSREGLHFHRARLVEALDRERAERALERPQGPRIDSGIAHHDEAKESQITAARQRLNEFDERHPRILAELQAKG